MSRPAMKHRSGGDGSVSPASLPFVLVLTGQALALIAFLLPWAAGDGLLAGRGLSGGDLALLLRRFDLAVESRVAVAGALALYLVPALSVGALLLNLLAALTRVDRRDSACWSLFLGLYPLAVTVGVLVVLASHRVEELGRRPQHGLLLTLAGSALWLAGALWQARMR